MNEKEYPFFRTTFTENVYKCNSELLPEDEEFVFLEIDKKFFKALIEIIRYGHNAFESKSKTRNYSIEVLKKYFNKDDFFTLVKDFGLNYIYLGEKSNEELIESFTMEGPYHSKGLSDKVETEAKNLGKSNNTKGLFVSYNGKVDIKLTETLITDKIYIKPFCSDLNNFTPTQCIAKTELRAPSLT